MAPDERRKRLLVCMGLLQSHEQLETTLLAECLEYEADGLRGSLRRTQRRLKRAQDAIVGLNRELERLRKLGRR